MCSEGRCGIVLAFSHRDKPAHKPILLMLREESGGMWALALPWSPLMSGPDSCKEMENGEGAGECHPVSVKGTRN